MSNKYWEGDALAKLKRSQVIGECSDTERTSGKVEFMNKVFLLWFNVRKITNNTDINFALRSKFSKELESAGREGWGWGVSDLEEAFEHIIENNGKWTEKKNCIMYTGGENKYFLKDTRQMVRAPTAIVNFANAIDSRFKKLYEISKQHKHQVKALNNFKKLGYPDPKQIKASLKKIHSLGKEAEPMLWLIPDLSDSLMEQIKLGKLITNFEIAINTAGDFSASGMGNKGALTIATLNTLLAVNLPLMGGVYAAIISRIPKFKKNAEKFIFKYTQSKYRCSNPHTQGGC